MIKVLFGATWATSAALWAAAAVADGKPLYAFLAVVSGFIAFIAITAYLLESSR